MTDLSGKVALVTGAGRYRGIGRDTALALAKAGADVAVTGTGRSPDTYPDDEKAMGWRDIESVADEIRDMGRRALTIVADLADGAQARGIVEQTAAELGSVDILVNNAAFAMANDRVPIVELDDAIWHRVLDIKIHGSYYASKAAAKEMIRQGTGGSIIMISSIAGKIHPATFAAYVVANMGSARTYRQLVERVGTLPDQCQLSLSGSHRHVAVGQQARQFSGRPRALGTVGIEHPDGTSGHRS